MHLPAFFLISTTLPLLLLVVMVVAYVGATWTGSGSRSNPEAIIERPLSHVDLDHWNSCEMTEEEFNLAPWVVTIRRVSASGQTVDFPGAVLDHSTVITQFVRYIVAPGSDWRLCEGAKYTVFTGSEKERSQGNGYGVIRVTPHPGLRLEGADENDHWLWMTQRYNLALVHLREPLGLGERLRPVCIPTTGQARGLKAQVQGTGTGTGGWGLISGWNHVLSTQRLTLRLDLIPEEQCLKLWSNITREEPFGDRVCGHNSATGTRMNPRMTCITLDGGTVLRDGNRSLLLGFTNDFYSNKEKGRCDEVATQYIATLNENSTDWIRRGQKCGSGSFACSDGSCTLLRNLCDGAADCPDGGDEDVRFCKPRNCCLAETEFACGVYGQCIVKRLGVGNCNDVVDCPGGEDEDTAICPGASILVTKDLTMTTKIAVGSGVAFAVVMVFVAILVVFIRSTRQRKFVGRIISEFLTNDDGGDQDVASGEGGDDIRRVRYDPALEYVLEKDMLGLRLGRGRFGAVYKARVHGEAVVVKTNHCPTANAEQVDLNSFISLLLELKMMLLLRRLSGHPHIVSLKGASTVHIMAYRLQIAMEYCPNGSLQAYLRRNRSCFQSASVRNLSQFTNFVESSSEKQRPQFTSVELVKWTMQIAQALQFLASKRIVHGDLATRNVVLDGGLNAKLCDFGLSHQISEHASTYTTTTRLDIPWPWAAPEVLRSLGRVCHRKSDVWTFGITTWEIFSLGQLTWAEVGDEKELRRVLDGGGSRPRPEYCPSDELHAIMTSCWKVDAESRPSFDDLALQLQSIFDSMCCTFEVQSNPECVENTSTARAPTESPPRQPEIVGQTQSGPAGESANYPTNMFAVHYVTVESLTDAIS